MKICTTSLLLKNILLHERKPDIGNGVEPSEQKNCPEGSTRWPSTQYFRSNLQVIYHISTHGTRRPDAYGNGRARSHALSVVLPAYNEEQIIAYTISTILD